MRRSKAGFHLPHLRQIGGPILPARSVVNSLGAIGCSFRANCPNFIAVAIFSTGFTSVVAAEHAVPSMIYASGCGGCAPESYSVPSPQADGIHRGYVCGPQAYANPETAATSRPYYSAPTQASPRRPRRPPHRQVPSGEPEHPPKCGRAAHENLSSPGAPVAKLPELLRGKG